MKGKGLLRVERLAEPLLPAIGLIGILLWLAGTTRVLCTSEFITAQVANLGAGVTSGGIIAWAVVLLQLKNDRMAREREEQLRTELERRQLATSLSLQGDLSGITLCDLDLRGLVLSRKRFVGAVLRRCDLRRVRLDGADLTDADMTQARLDEADLRGAVLTRAELSEAQLQGADLRGADLAAADLRKADLRNANLTGASLAGANIADAILSGAQLQDVDFSGVDENQLRAARSGQQPD